MQGRPYDEPHGLRLVASRCLAGSPSGEFARYCAASALALAVDFGTLVLLTEVAGIHYLASAAAGFGLGVAVAYALGITWVFSARRLTNVSAERAVFFLIGVAGVIINHIAMLTLTEIALLPYTVSKLGSAGLVFTFNFSLRKGVLFTVPIGPER